MNVTSSGVGGHSDVLSTSAGVGSTSNGLSASFGNLVAQAGGALQEAEKLSIASMEGRASTPEVVHAIMEAERQVQFALAVRDKITSAFLELTHMSI